MIAVGGNFSSHPEKGGHQRALRGWGEGLRRAGYDSVLVDRDTPRGGEILRGADLVLNIMGFLPPGMAPEANWAFLDIDPGYPQLWKELGLADVLAGHDLFATLGENIGRAECATPTCGLSWVGTPPPVVVDEWPASSSGAAFTSVCTWRNPYGTVNWKGSTYGSRVHEFRKFLALPRMVDAEFELALEISPEESRDLRALKAHGWRLVDPRTAAGTQEAYRSYIQGSRAEICIAQNMYVATRCGWLSDRSVCYLASGKPVLAQDTGFSDNYPVGEGLLAFSSLEEAAAGVEEIERNYDRHSRAARELAEQYFDAEKVVVRVIERLSAAARK